MRMGTSSRYLTTAEAAAKLDLTPRQVRNLIASGVLPGEKRGRDYLIPESALARAAEGVRPGPGRPPGRVEST